MTINPDLLDGVKLTTALLNDRELATLNNCLEFDDAYQICSLRPWFEKVRGLFTENEGKAMHPDTRKAVAQIVLMRLQ